MKRFSDRVVIARGRWRRGEHDTFEHGSLCIERSYRGWARGSGDATT